MDISSMTYRIIGAIRPWFSKCEDQASATSCLTGICVDSLDIVSSRTRFSAAVVTRPIRQVCVRGAFALVSLTGSRLRRESIGGLLRSERWGGNPFRRLAIYLYIYTVVLVEWLRRRVKPQMVRFRNRGFRGFLYLHHPITEAAVDSIGVPCRRIAIDRSVRGWARP